MKPLRQLLVSGVCAVLFTLQAQVPQLLNFQGRVAVDGVNFDGNGLFKFALVNGDASAAFWSNDGSAVAGTEPALPVAVPVEQGLYSVLLGDATLTNMSPIPATVFTNADVRLRVWFSDGTNGFQRLEPDSRIAAVGYAMMAANVAEGSITASKLAPGAVTGAAIAPGAIQGAQLAPNAAAENLRASGQSGVARGGIVLCEQSNSTELTEAGYVRIGQVDLDTEVWEQHPANAVPSPRAEHSAVWTGREMILWGGRVFTSPTGGLIENSGVQFDPVSGRWREVSRLGAPAASRGHTAVWTGQEMIVWGGGAAGGGRYDPLMDTWRPLSSVGAPNTRIRHTAIWTGSEMIIWGGSAGDAGASLSTGARYNPSTDRWAPLSSEGSPSPRSGHTAVWAGQAMLIWGGRGYDAANPGISPPLGDGARYDPIRDLWTPMSTDGALSARSGHTAVWTGAEMLVLGGEGEGGALSTHFGRYNPSTDAWATQFQPAHFVNRQQHTTVWADHSAISWGGLSSTGSLLASGSVFTPALNQWAGIPMAGGPAAGAGHTAVWTGSEMLIFSAVSPCFGRFSPGRGQWTSLEPSVSVAGRRGHTAVWTGTEFLVWGGAAGSNSKVLATGFHYNPSTDSLREIPLDRAPAPRVGHTAVWTGSEMVVWGGSPSDTPLGPGLNTGARYNPRTRTWSTLPISPSTPLARSGHSAVWTGAEMIIWGGRDSRGVLDSGARYLASSNLWVTLPTSGAPDARAGHTAVWTGTEMIVWGGYSSISGATVLTLTNVNTGGHYDPALNAWTQSTPLFGAPPARNGHRALWTGSEMIVWGGSADDGRRSTGLAPFNLASGARYDPARESWVAMNTNGVPPFLACTLPTSYRLPDAVPTAVWTGSQVLVWGSVSLTSTNRITGVAYSPADDAWTPLTQLAAPGSRAGHTAVWTGRGMLLFGGVRDRTSVPDPVIYSYLRSKPMHLYQHP